MGRSDALRWKFNNEIQELLSSGGLSYEDRQFIRDKYTGWGGLVKGKSANGQFFTPGNVVKMIHDIIQPGPGQSVLDLSCGTGAFFEGLKDCRIYGVELDSTAARLASICFPGSMILNGDAIENFFQFEQEGVDITFGNPPFGLKIGGDWKHKRDFLPSQEYTDRMAPEVRYSANRSRLTDSAAAFVEMSIRSTRPGGMIALVLPQSVFAGQAYASIRKYMMAECLYLATIQLPPETFYFSGTGVGTSVAIMRRKWQGWENAVINRYGVDTDGRPWWPIIMAQVECVGWDSRGRPVHWMDDAGARVTADDGKPIVRDETTLIPSLFLNGWPARGSLGNELYFNSLDARTIFEYLHFQSGKEVPSVRRWAMLKPNAFSASIVMQSFELEDNTQAFDRMLQSDLASERLFDKPTEPSELADILTDLREHEVRAEKAMDSLKDMLGELGFDVDFGQDNPLVRKEA